VYPLPQDAHRLFFVLVLAAFGLTPYDDPRWNVFDLYGGVSDVSVLSAFA